MSVEPGHDPVERLRRENDELRERLREAEETLRAIREGEVDAVIVSGSKGDRVFSLTETENLHRLMVQTMNEAGLAATTDGTLVFCNDQACILLGRAPDQLVGHPLGRFVAEQDRRRFARLLERARSQPIDDRILFLDVEGGPVPMHLWASCLDRVEDPLICLIGSDLRRLEADQEVIAQLQEQQAALRQHAEALETLSRTATRLLEPLGYPEIYAAVADRLYSIAGRSIVVVCEFEAATRRLELREVRCSPDERGLIEDILGRGPEGLSLDFPEESTPGAASGKLVDVQPEVLDPWFRQLPPALRVSLARDLGIRHVFGMGCVHRQELMAAVALLTREGDELPKRSLIELAVKQAALCLGRKRSDQHLFETNEQLRALMQALPVGISFSSDPTCVNITGNPALLAQFEMTPEDNLSASAEDPSAPGRRVRYFRDGRELEPNELPLQQAAAENQYIAPMELEIRLPSGRTWHAETSGAPVRDAQGRVVCSLAVTQDISARIEAERQLRELNETLEERVILRTAEVQSLANQLRALAVDLSRAEMNERKRLAKILHDHIQQLLVAARMQVDRIKRDGGDLVRQTAWDVDALLQESLDASRSLTVELSPVVVQEAGLIGGLKFLAARMRERSEFTVLLHLDAAAEPESEEIRFILFDAARELLLNALKHSGVREAEIRLDRGGEDRIRIEVSDRGRGFDPLTFRMRRVDDLTFGLFSIEQHLAYVGGSMKIEAAPGQGTRIILTCPAGPPPRPKVPGDGGGAAADGSGLASIFATERSTTEGTTERDRDGADPLERS